MAVVMTTVMMAVAMVMPNAVLAPSRALQAEVKIGCLCLCLSLWIGKGGSAGKVDGGALRDAHMHTPSVMRISTSTFALLL